MLDEPWGSHQSQILVGIRRLLTTSVAATDVFEADVELLTLLCNRTETELSAGNFPHALIRKAQSTQQVLSLITVCSSF